MQALYVSDGKLSFVSNYPVPEPNPDQALIRVTMAGICSTDLEIVKGYHGFSGILGHEFVGVVEKAIEADWIGRRVVGGINLGCNRCKVCASHGPEHCPDRTVLGILGHDGAFAQYLVLPLSNLEIVPDRLSDEIAVFTEPLAAAVRIRDQLIISPTAEIAVIGPGRLGLLIGQVLALSGTPVTMIGRSLDSLRLPRNMGLKSGLQDEFEENSFDMVIEATGNAHGFEQALWLVRPLGTLVLKSTYDGKATVDLSKIVVDEINVVGSRCGPFSPALRLLEQGAVDVRPFIEAQYPLSEGLAALQHAAEPRVRKILLQVS
ncbi:MAG TPA: alcohol dehydrogenase catalytic domain-containing protein [Patescibacteria group bacterium]|nr:alcohol dehydrogenase catalytic domain-containing protein [Patescibacteria group bacterium]